MRTKSSLMKTNRKAKNYVQRNDLPIRHNQHKYLVMRRKLSRILHAVSFSTTSEKSNIVHSLAERTLLHVDLVDSRGSTNL